MLVGGRQAAPPFFSGICSLAVAVIDRECYTTVLAQLHDGDGHFRQRFQMDAGVLEER